MATCHMNIPHSYLILFYFFVSPTGRLHKNPRPHPFSFTSTVQTHKQQHKKSLSLSFMEFDPIFPAEKIHYLSSIFSGIKPEIPAFIPMSQENNNNTICMHQNNFNNHFQHLPLNEPNHDHNHHHPTITKIFTEGSNSSILTPLFCLSSSSGYSYRNESLRGGFANNNNNYKHSIMPYAPNSTQNEPMHGPNRAIWDFSQKIPLQYSGAGASATSSQPHQVGLPLLP